MTQVIEQWAIYGSLLTAGLAGSLHCLGMCGPILFGFAEVFRAADSGTARGSSLWLDLTAYHAGRLWTYAAMGLAAGWMGQGLREGAPLLGWQQPVSLLLGGGVILSGLLLSGWLPGLRVDALLDGCGLQHMRRWKWFAGLLRTPGIAARLLVGVVMGFLPCGLVYAMLVVVAALPSPMHAALGMLAFGIGTLPALSGLLALRRLAPPWIRKHGTRVAALLLIVTGCLMVYRGLWATSHTHGHHLGSMRGSAVETLAPGDLNPGE